MWLKVLIFIIYPFISLGQINFVPNSFKGIVGFNGFVKDGFVYSFPKVNYLVSEPINKNFPFDPFTSQPQEHHHQTHHQQQQQQFQQQQSTLVSSPALISASEPFKHLVPSSDLLAAAPSYHSESAKVKESNEEATGGYKHHAKNYLDHGKETKKGYKSDHHQSKGKQGKYGDVHKLSHHGENGGNKAAHHDEGSHYKKYHEGKKSHKASKFKQKKGHKKGHKTKGYHNKFIKDEYHKEHRFYDDAHKSGEYSKYGDFHKKYEKKEGKRKKGGSHKSGHYKDKHGGLHDEQKGSEVEEHKGYKGKHGKEKFHKNNNQYKKKKSHDGGKTYGFVDGDQN